METPATYAGMSILVVEDDVRSAQMLADLLRSDGYSVEVCAGGSSGVERLRYDPLPDVLLTDLRMPAIDGATVVRAARGRRPSMPVIIVTAYPQMAQRLGAGPVPSLFIKPLDYDALLAKLAELQANPPAETTPW